MAWGLPKLPGLCFADPTKTQHHMKSSLRFYQGYRFPDSIIKAPGGEPSDCESNAFGGTEDAVNYDPSMTYGRVKQPAFPAVIPHWAHYDKRCLNFTAFMKQPVYESPDEKYRVRLVNIVYFIEDDTLTVMEPRVKNSGIWQGRMVKRGKIPKNDQGEFWHWKDLDVGKDICIYGKVFHTVSCDLFTKEWLESQGLEISKPEDLPTDPYTAKERWKNVKPPTLKRSKDDTLRRFLEYDGRVLAFDCLWDDRESENGELHQYKLLYFLQDDTIAIKELHDNKGGRDPFPLLLKRTKLPKKWKEIPVTFPKIAMEVTEEEVTEYYAPIDLIVGQTVFILGRRFLLFDCDNFTRKYYKTMLNIDQPPSVEVPKEKKKEHVTKLPPHIGIGTPEDSLQSCFGLMPKRPYKDVIKYNLNASKYLRYLCELDWIHPEDKGRQFVLSYSLADGSIKVGEIPRRNSGFREGTFLKSMKLQTPDSDPNFPTYFTPEKFFIGAIVPIFKHRFRITGCDLYVYRYMSANPEKFPPEVIDNVRNYHMREGNLKDELEEAIQEEQLAQKRAELAQIGEKAVAEPSPMERCLEALNVSEESAIPMRAATPPATTDRISYDDSLRVVRESKPTCDNVVPLKGILKSGSARDDHQKVVCFSGPVPDKRETKETTKSKYPQEGSQFNEDEDYCDKYKDLGADERAERRQKGICAYDIIPNDEGDANSKNQANISGYLGNYGVDCRKTPDYMRLPPNAYEMAKTMRQEVPDISPGAAKIAGYPSLPFPEVGKCTESIQPDPCKKIKENVLFACPHVEPVVQCCDPRKRVPQEY